MPSESTLLDKMDVRAGELVFIAYQHYVRAQSHRSVEFARGLKRAWSFLDVPEAVTIRDDLAELTYRDDLYGRVGNKHTALGDGELRTAWDEVLEAAKLDPRLKNR